ncbi:hypothetical protein BLA29_012792 [Euroglyphus maynei]|uniref:Uncharacterized protein n=1 Tax=Euroglyphus maynei TaxID=6958 RepID=A0A1Y3AV45_EURMA|nr:hypothetical protein BLA29_012792 [Euroglyphus maynei]
MSTGSLEGYKLGPRKKSGLNGSAIGRPTTSSFNRASSFTKQSSPIVSPFKMKTQEKTTVLTLFF